MEFPLLTRKAAESMISGAVERAEERTWARARESYDALISEQSWLQHNQVWLSALGGGKSRLDENLRRSYVERSRANALHNPLYVRALQTYFTFVFGRGISRPRLADDWVESLQSGERATDALPREAEALEAIVKTFWTAPDSQHNLTGYHAQQKRYMQLLTDGELPLLIFERGGKFTVGCLDSLELQDFIEHPKKAGTPLAWKRQYATRSGGQITEWYPAAESVGAEDELAKQFNTLGVKDAGSGSGRGGRLIDKIDGTRVWLWNLVVNRADPLGIRGVPPFFSVLPWSAAAQDLTSNLRTYLRALSAWAWKVKLGQGATAANVSSVKSQLASQFSGAAYPTNPAPVVGSVRVETQGQDLEPITFGAGGAQAFETAIKTCLDMVYAGTGLPSHYFGNVDTGNLATASAMELPVRKLFESEQQWWTELYDTLFQWMGRVSGLVVDAETVIEIDFPTIVERDATALLQGLSQATMAPLIAPEDACRTAAALLGADDIEAWVERLTVGSADTQAAGATELEAMIRDNPLKAAPVVLRLTRKVREGMKRVQNPVD
jgi:hypothetical protein